jgi:hypothetical protein
LGGERSHCILLAEGLSYTHLALAGAAFSLLDLLIL